METFSRNGRTSGGKQSSAARRGTEKPPCVLVSEAVSVLQNMCGVRASGFMAPPPSPSRAASSSSRARARPRRSASSSSGSSDTRAYTSSVAPSACTETKALSISQYLEHIALAGTVPRDRSPRRARARANTHVEVDVDDAAEDVRRHRRRRRRVPADVLEVALRQVRDGAALPRQRRDGPRARVPQVQAHRAARPLCRRRLRLLLVLLPLDGVEVDARHGRPQAAASSAPPRSALRNEQPAEAPDASTDGARPGA